MRGLIALEENGEGKNSTHIMKSIEETIITQFKNQSFSQSPVKTFAIGFATTKQIYAHSKQDNHSQKQPEI